MSSVIQSRMSDGTLEKRYFLDDGKCWLWERYREDKLEECKQWDANGTPIDHRFYKNGKPDGIYRRWHNNGQPRVQQIFKDGVPEGKYETWYNAGQPWSLAFCKGGQFEGEYQVWYDNGQIQSRSFYRNGKKDGESRYWHDNGTIQFHTYYQGGTIDSKFSLKKKLSALYMKKYLRIRPPIINDYLISDLSKMVSG